MNNKDFIYNKSDSSFIKELYNDINKRNKINKNASLFIANYKLKELTKIKKGVSISDLPHDTQLGVVYLIKNNSMFEFYSFFCNERRDIRFSEVPDLYFKCIVTVHNLNYSDIGDFVNADSFIGMDELISHDINRSLNFMMALISNGFKMYVREY